MMMGLCKLLLFLTLWVGISGRCCDLEIVSREEWGARPPKDFTPMELPVQYLFIHHTAGPTCSNKTECSAEMRRIQDFHMDDRGWDDIGYNYLIGGDGRAYTARGWPRVGAHTYGYNSVGVAISLMGNFVSAEPPDIMLTATRNLIECAIEEGVLNPKYELFGHRDGSSCTVCPGEMLYSIIRTWPDYSCRDIPKYCPSSTG